MLPSEAIVGILKNHMDDPEIARNAINALGRLAISAENMDRIAQVITGPNATFLLIYRVCLRPSPVD